MPMAATEPALARGDRAPNFLLPANDGLWWVFYERVRGRRNALLLLDPADRDEERALLADLAGAATDLDAAGLDVFVIRAATLAENRTLSETVEIPGLLLADPERRIVAAYAAALGRAPGGAICLLLDENQRLLQTVDTTPGAGLAHRLIASSASEPTPAGPPLLTGVAPVLIIPHVLDRETCRGLIDRWHTHGHEEGQSQSRDAGGQDMRRVEHSVKKRRDHFLRDRALVQRLATVIGRRIAPELAKAFRLQGFRFDGFVVTCYDAERGDYFRPHRDNTTQETADRMYALTLNLNSEQYEGGGLRFPEYGPNLYTPPSGGAILFSCSLVHEATPVTRGRRFTLLSFLRDPNPSAQAGPLGVWGGGQG